MREAGQLRAPLSARAAAARATANSHWQTRAKLESQAGLSLLRAGSSARSCARTFGIKSLYIVDLTMPSRPVGLGPALSLPLRVRPPVVRWRNDRFHCEVQPFIRCSSSSKHLPVSKKHKGPNTESLPHVSEEATSMAKLTVGKGPNFCQGTPVQEVC
jgi:hypothetical protein